MILRTMCPILCHAFGSKRIFTDHLLRGPVKLCEPVFRKHCSKVKFKIENVGYYKIMLGCQNLHYNTKLVDKLYFILMGLIYVHNWTTSSLKWFCLLFYIFCRKNAFISQTSLSSFDALFMKARPKANPIKQIFL